MSPWTNQAVSLIILTEAAHGFSGMFGYSPATGPGNLIFSIAAAAGTDPFGNPYPAGLSTTAGSGTIEGTDYIINAAGAFFYSGAPASGNLIASIASGAGTDSFGNAYLNGLVSYNNVDGTTSRIGNGDLSFTGTSFSTLQNGSEAGTVFREPINARQPGGTGPEVWNSLGALAITGLTVVRGRYRLLADGDVEIDFAFSTSAAVSQSFAAFSTTLVAPYLPAAGSAAAAIGASGSAWTISASRLPSLLVTTSGAVQVSVPAIASGVVGGCTLRYPTS